MGFFKKARVFLGFCQISPKNTYFDLGFSGDFSVARLGFSIFLEWQHWPAWSKMSEAVLSQKSRHVTKDYKLNTEAEVNSSRVCFA